MITHGRRAFALGFTLLELLVVITVVAVLAALALPIYNLVFRKSHQLVAMSNMRQVGSAFILYAGEHNNAVPGRTKGADEDGKPKPRWPSALHPYLQDLHIYGAPLDDTNGKSYRVDDLRDYLSDTTNNTSYIGNGYNDLGAYEDDSVEIRLNSVGLPSETIMLGTPLPKKNNFYMDFEEKNNKNVLNLNAFGEGSNYFFTDGSSRYLKCLNPDDIETMRKEPKNGETYTDWLWLVDKSQASAQIN